MTKLNMSCFITIAITLVLTSPGTSDGKQDSRNFGDCLEGHESCSECYLTLKESLLSRDDNIQNLSAAFYPWSASIPIFVTVTFSFNNSNHSEVWYWTTDSSYLFFEITTFQYLSLFFSKPAALFSQEVTLTLEEDCIEADDKMFKLLTQRLKNLIEKKDLNPEIDENYFARTEKDTENLFTTSVSIYILVFYITGFIISVTITVPMLWIYYCNNTEQWDALLKCKDSKSKICTIALTAEILMLYILILDIMAVYTLEDKLPVLIDRNIDDRDLPFIVLSFDSLMMMCILLAIILCGILKWCQIQKCKKFQTLLKAIFTVGPVLILVIHLPFIAIAYLNDASYATSIFIYYTVVAFVIFGSLELIYGMFQQAIISRGTTQNVRINQDSEGSASHEVNNHCFTSPQYKKIVQGFCGTLIVSVIFLSLMLVLIGMTTAALVVIPVSRTFSDAPNRLLGFYETVIVVAGAYLAYKGIFRKKTTLEAAIKKRRQHIRYNRDDTVWQQLSEDGKVAEFYDYIADIIAKYNPQQEPINAPNRGDGTENGGGDAANGRGACGVAHSGGGDERIGEKTPLIPKN